jgi:alpha-tubulin suppressor-like RCC1 family protein
MNNGVTFYGPCKPFAISTKAGSAFVLLGDGGQVTGWGEDSFANRSNYYYLTGINNISAGYDHCLVLTNDKKVISWGSNAYGKSSIDKNLTGVVDIKAGGDHSLALLENATVTGWGANNANFCSGLTGVIAISAGDTHSLALLNNGKITGWGTDDYLESSAGAELSEVVGISAGEHSSFAVFNDGTITGWGWDNQGKISEGMMLTGVTSVSAGINHSLALLNNGKVTGWGWDICGQSTNGKDVTGAVAISAGANFSLALISDGSITGWGCQGNEGSTLTGQCSPVTYFDFNGLDINNTYVVGRQNTWTHVSYLGHDVTINKWGTGQNYESISYIPPSSTGNYLFYGNIIDNQNYLYYGNGTGVLTISSGSLFFSLPSGRRFRLNYDGNSHNFPCILLDLNNTAYGNVCGENYFDIDKNISISGPPTNAGRYLVDFSCDTLNNYSIATIGAETGLLEILPLQATDLAIVVKSFTNPYTAQPNPLNAFTYPKNIPLDIKYNGFSDPPTETGTYSFSINSLSGNYIINPVTGTYSIEGKLEWSNFAMAWGNNFAHTAGATTAPSGLPGVQKVVGGKDFAVALMSDNSIVTWGTGNEYGQQNIPYVDNFVKDIFACNNTTFIVDWTGQLTGCGYLFNTLNDQTYGISGYTGIIPNLTGISSVSAADYYAIAIPSDTGRRITGWGDLSKNYFDYRAGLGNRAVKEVCASNFGYIVKKINDNIYAFGANTSQGGLYGQYNWAGADYYNVKKIACADCCTALVYNNNTVNFYGQQINATGGFVNFTIPDASIQGKVLDASVSNSHVLLSLSEYVSPPPPPPPDCNGITYAN